MYVSLTMFAFTVKDATVNVIYIMFSLNIEME